MSIYWATPEHTIYFIGFAICCIIVALRVIKTIKTVTILTHSSRRLIEHYSRTKLFIKALLYSASLFFLYIAMLSPQWGKKNNEITQEGRDVLIALDISKSMLAQDDQPNRLEFAKQKIKKFISMLDSDRVGLILFSGSSFIQVPLTRDIDSFFNFLEQVDVESISGGSTALDKAIKQALDMVDASLIQHKRVLVVLTDGEDFSTDLASIKDRAQKEKLTIVTLGLGSLQGAPIPLYEDGKLQQGHMKKKDGSIVISRLNESYLKKIAQETGGVYVKATIDNTDIMSIVEHIQRYEKHKFDSKKFDAYEQQYPYAVLLSFICLALEWIL